MRSQGNQESGYRASCKSKHKVDFFHNIIIRAELKRNIGLVVHNRDIIDLPRIGTC